MGAIQSSGFLRSTYKVPNGLCYITFNVWNWSDTGCPMQIKIHYVIVSILSMIQYQIMSMLFMIGLHRLIMSTLIKACTYRPIFRGLAAESAVESADSIPESADSTTDFVIVGRLPVLNMFNISTLTLLPSADCKSV